MDLKHFGDSYDIVKRSLLQWLADFGPWEAHPMFTHPVSESQAKTFSRFLGVPLVSTATFVPRCDRRAYLASARKAYHSLFLDPDVGLRLEPISGKRSVRYLFADEVDAIVPAKAQGLVMVYDQALPRGDEVGEVKRKLSHFVSRGVSGFAYLSHASFLVVGKSESLVAEARERLVEASGLPEHRIVSTALGLTTVAAG